jgi:hypothetical protein
MLYAFFQVQNPVPSNPEPCPAPSLNADPKEECQFDFQEVNEALTITEESLSSRRL